MTSFFAISIQNAEFPLQRLRTNTHPGSWFLNTATVPTKLASGTGDNLEALIGERPHKQGRENALAADAFGQFFEGGILENSAGVGGGLG